MKLIFGKALEISASEKVNFLLLDRPCSRYPDLLSRSSSVALRTFRSSSISFSSSCWMWVLRRANCKSCLLHTINIGVLFSKTVLLFKISYKISELSWILDLSLLSITRMRPLQELSKTYWMRSRNLKCPGMSMHSMVNSIPDIFIPFGPV